jgi:NDP-sugar pyrophosphorylase family protein
MKAMILAAGFGTRLRPLTDKKPKALMPIVNKPLIARVIAYLESQGVHQIIANAHHHYQQVVDYLGRGNPFGLNVEVRVEREILGTGGGIKNTEDFWDEDAFVVINTDIWRRLTNTTRRAEHSSHWCSMIAGRTTRSKSTATGTWLASMPLLARGGWLLQESTS